MALQEHQIEVMPTMASGVASLLLLHAQLFSELVIWWAAYQRALGRGLTDEQSWDEADGIMQRILPFDREIKPNEELERLMHAYFYFMRTGFALGKDREIVPEYRGKLTAEYLLQHPLPLVLGREVLNGVGEAATGDWPQFMEQALNLRLGEHLPWLATEREFVETGLVKGPAFDMMSKMDFNALGIKGFADFKELELSTQAYLLMLIDLMFDNNAWRHAGDLVSWGRR